MAQPHVPHGPGHGSDILGVPGLHEYDMNVVEVDGLHQFSGIKKCVFFLKKYKHENTKHRKHEVYNLFVVSFFRVFVIKMVLPQYIGLRS